MERQGEKGGEKKMLKPKVRTHDIHIKLTKAEFKILKALAEKEHLPISSAVRQVLFQNLEK